MNKVDRQIYDVIVIGAGPSGMMAALTASSEGAKVLLLEKNPSPGKKLLLTGHGRCNITNIRIMDNYRETYHENARFITSALHAFSPEDVRAFFASIGIPTHKEDAGRIFPDSQKASDVCFALEDAVRKSGAELLAEAAVTSVSLVKDPSGDLWCVKTKDSEYKGRAVVLASGGKSFPHTGSTGDGYRIAENMDHEITPIRPALAPLFLASFSDPMTDRCEDCGAEFTLAGITLPDVGTALSVDGKTVTRSRGDLLFTHQGVSGPSAMSLSRYLPTDTGKYPEGKVRLIVDLLPDISEEEAGKNLLSAMTENPNRHMKRLLCETFHFQEKIALLLLGETMDLSANQVTKKMRNQITEKIKRSSFDIEKCTPLDMAYVTAGGVSVRQIDPKTMGSKVKEGLFFCGEVIDIDGISGGYNLQNAWSTGRAAGLSAAAFSRREERRG